MQTRVNETAPLAIAIVGAGIVGCATAFALALDGHRVTVFDPDLPGAGTSSGNAGGIVTGSVTPTATPDVLRALPSYLLDRSSPAVLRMRHSIRVLPWLVRFIRAARPAEVDRISAALHPLVSQSLAAHQTLASRCGAQSLIGQEGWLKVYGSQQEFEAAALDRRLMDRFGVRYTILDRKALADLEPNLDPSLCLFGLHQFESGFVRNPGALANAYLEGASRLGAVHLRRHVKGVARGPQAGATVHAEDGVRSFDRLVIAAGAWSANLVRQVGDRVSLDTERGYHIAFGEETGRLLRGPVVIPRLSLVLSPMHDGVRLVSGDELAGLKAPPNYSRIRALIPSARSALPALKDRMPVTEWMGFRPSTPDSLPVIGPSPRNPDVFYAFGHGHLGLTMAARTAELVRDGMTDRRSKPQLAPYLIDRFG